MEADGMTLPSWARGQNPQEQWVLYFSVPHLSGQMESSGSSFPSGVTEMFVTHPPCCLTLHLPGAGQARSTGPGLHSPARHSSSATSLTPLSWNRLLQNGWRLPGARHCMSLPWQLWRMTTYSVPSDNTHWVSFSPGGHKSEMKLTELISRCQQSCIPSQGPGGNGFSCLFQLPRVTPIPWLMTPSSNFKASSVASLSYVGFQDHMSPDSDSPAFLLERPSGLHLGSTHSIQDHLPSWRTLT